MKIVKVYVIEMFGVFLYGFVIVLFDISKDIFYDFVEVGCCYCRLVEEIGLSVWSWIEVGFYLYYKIIFLMGIIKIFFVLVVLS